MVGDAMEPIIRAAAVSSESRQLSRALKEPAPLRAPGTLKPVPAAAPAPDPAPALPPAPFDALAPAPAREHDALLQREQALAALRQQAEEQGFAAGLERAQQAAAQLRAEQARRLGALMESLQLARADALAEAEDTMIDIAYTAVCKIIGEQALAADGIAAMVRAAIGQFRDREQLVVQLHPQDVSLLQQAGGEPFQPHGVQVRADATIAVGGCSVSGATGALDARLDQQLAALKDTLLAARAARAAGEAAV
jgi:flagellar assembly protein FliH